MILLPDEDELPVGAQVNAVIGAALRQSVAGVEPSAAFEAKLAAALDAVELGGQAGEDGRGAPAAGRQSSEAGEAGREAGQGSRTAEAAS